jgi:ATP-binding protein involved in chromosome partitioning
MNGIEQTIQNHFKQWAGLDSEEFYVKAEHIQSVQWRDGQVLIDVEIGYPCLGQIDAIRTAIEQYLKQCVLNEPYVIQTVQCNIRIGVVSHQVRHGLKRLHGVKNIIAVASGKGGVGKSTTAVNLALALAREGATVGIMDADIYGPSIPAMLKLSGKPAVSEAEKGWAPMRAYGLEAISIGVLIDEDTPMVWRGPMASGALEQLLNETRWGALDYLVVDLPPGTGDIQLTLAQKVPLTGVVIVTTPQDIALLDVKKGLKMFEKVQVPILGVIENMSLHTCSKCGHTEAIFGEEGGKHFAEQYHAPFLGSLPLDIRIRQQADAGEPIVVNDSQGRLTQAYVEISRRLSVQLAKQPKDYSGKFPKIVMA